MHPYNITRPSNFTVPILLSIPHCGTDFPSELKENYLPKIIDSPDDTDWFVDRLYNFAPKMGITMITARYSRWVIDLNRSLESKPLYNDGRIITKLCTTTDFHGNDIYPQKNVPDQKEIDRRIRWYYQPYYQKIQEQLDELQTAFGQVLLWDAHSIRQHVPTIRKEPFPEMVLGSADGTSADGRLIDTALNELSANTFELKHNTPFKGGQITRTFGKPAKNQHALQLEMNKVLYMDDTEIHFDEHRANKVRVVLRNTLEKLVGQLVQ